MQARLGDALRLGKNRLRLSSGSEKRHKHHLSICEQYACGLLWAIRQFLGDVGGSAVNLPEHAFSVASLLMGFILSAGFVSFITTHMTRLQMKEFEQPSLFCRQARVPWYAAPA